MNPKNTPFPVGSTVLTITDPKNNLSFPVLLHYPTLDASKSTPFGPFIMDVAVDGVLAEGKFPLVLISHGNSGSQYVYRTISTYLAARGFIVAMPEHFGNNRTDNSLSDSVKNLEYRPQHISLIIDYLLDKTTFKQQINPDTIALIGHSFGGYTALAVAGGKPYSMTGEAISTHKDERVKALVIMAPAAGYFSPKGALDQVNIPILLYIATEDIYTSKKWTADVILKGIQNPEQVRLREIKNAGHFSFISPFPDGMKKPSFLPANDPEGFDRVAFHEELPEEIFQYLEEKLTID